MPLQPGTTLGPYAVTGRKGVVHIAQVADLVARARSPVVRHGYSRDIEDTPEPEMPVNELGQERWECYHVSDNGQGRTFYFKRNRSNVTAYLKDLLKLGAIAF